MNRRLNPLNRQGTPQPRTTLLLFGGDFWVMPMQTRSVGRRCGAVRYDVTDEPLRTGTCNCTDCRKSSGSAFAYLAVWPRDGFNSSGPFSTFNGRSFCSVCGSQVFSLFDTEAEITLGSLDEAPTGLVPDYELWIKRRENWLVPISDADQFMEDRTGVSGDGS